ncbi:penicillin-binding protein activator [Psychromonas ossibalaenae]|uniref:penicillin-binding protein activator n=1 Tax=Psychromonas ossibalaenae TaxID=444922 RepID=UPI00039CC93F|nr:penicillin-binding protein activator [Psychromonas ossibalaenae]
MFTSTKRFSQLLIMLLTLSILSACSTMTSPEDTPPEAFTELDYDSAFYLKKDQEHGTEDNSAWQMAAVQALIQERKFVLADSIIEHLQSKELSESEQASLSLLIADGLGAQGRQEQARQTINSIDAQHLSSIGLIHYLKLKAVLEVQMQDPQAASDTLLLLSPLLAEDEQQAHNDLLLTQLSLLPAEILNQYQPLVNAEEIEAPEMPIEIPAVEKPAVEKNEFKEGWYALAGIYQSFQLRPNQLIRSIDEWKNRYPTHPVLEYMPSQLTDIPEASPYQPQNIAVLIPLSGRFQQQGKAIQYGLLDAYYRQQQTTQDSAEQLIISQAAKLTFYDTNGRSMEEIVLKLKTDNIDFVIGPLLKSDIKEFLPLAQSLPVLALNSFAKQTAAKPADKSADPVDENQPAVNKVAAWHYAFPISPEDEAKQAAWLINQQSHKTPLVIAPDSAYGKRIASAFKQKWAELNPEKDNTTEAYYFTDKAQLPKFIDQALQTGKSKSRISQMQAITKLPLKTEVRSRRDIDAIYIISKRDELTLLKPFIEVSISPFASKIPLYASSRSHKLDLRGKQDRELSGVSFSDMPFLINDNNEIMKEVQQSWQKQSFATLRLFSLGFDSYQLIERLMQLQVTEGAFYPGLTGDLSLDKTNTVQAKLSWAVYKNGKLSEIAPLTPAE